MCGGSQDADLPPLNEEVLGGKFDPEQAIEDSAKGAEGREESLGGGEEGGSSALGGRDLRLKGADALVYMCAARLGLRPMVLRIVWDECGKVTMPLL